MEADIQQALQAIKAESNARRVEEHSHFIATTRKKTSAVRARLGEEVSCDPLPAPSVEGLHRQTNARLEARRGQSMAASRRRVAIGLVALVLIPALLVTGWIVLRPIVPGSSKRDIFDEEHDRLVAEGEFTAGVGAKPNAAKDKTDSVAEALRALPQVPTAPFSGEEIYARAAPAVVVIRCFAAPNDAKAIAQGSGFIVEPGDIVITNAHVIKGASILEIMDSRGRTARLTTALAIDKKRDVAILPLPKELRGPKGLKMASHLPRVGSKVFALGAPKGLAFSLTSGIVSQLRSRKGEDGPAFVQTDTSISPGSSGGPLLNDRAQVVGVTTLGSLSSAEAHNLNFAVAASELLKVIKTKRGTDNAIQLVDEMAADAMAWYNRAVAYKDQGRKADALAACQAAVKLKPDFTEAWYLLGLEYVGTGQNSKAISAFQRVAKLKPDHADAWFSLGFAYGLNRQMADSNSAYQRAAKLKPDDAGAWYWLGLSYKKLQRNTEAVAALRKATKLEPRNAHAWYQMSLAYSSLDRKTDALVAIEKAVKFQPDYPEAWYYLGLLYGAAGKKNKTREAWQRLKKLDPARAAKLKRLLR